MKLKSKDFDWSSKKAQKILKKLKKQQDKLKRASLPPSEEQMQKITFTI